MDAREFCELMLANIEARGRELSSGELALTLNPRCVALLHELLTQYESEGTCSEVPLREISALYSFFSRLPALVVHPSGPNVKDAAPNFSSFAGLTSLQLVDLSEVAVDEPLRARLQLLAVRGMLHSFEFPGLFASTMQWPSLRKLDLSQNFLRDDDRGLLNATMTSLTNLNLSHNLLTCVPNLDGLVNLQRLNLSFNRVSTVKDIKERVGGVSSLLLQGNQLVSTAGLEYLLGLKMLDLRDNKITVWKDIEALRRLPLLDDLWLSGNPVSSSSTYRQEVFLAISLNNVLRDSQLFRLDGVNPLPQELAEFDRIRQQQPKERGPGNSVLAPHTTNAASSVAAAAVVTIPTATAAAVKKKKKKKAVAVLEEPVVKPKNAPPGIISSSPTTASSFVPPGSSPTQRSPVPGRGMVAASSPVAASTVSILSSSPQAVPSPAIVLPPSPSVAPAEFVSGTPSPASQMSSSLRDFSKDEEEFAQRVRKLHDEGGSNWLMILDGMQQEEQAKSDPVAVQPRMQRQKSGGSVGGHSHHHHRQRSGGGGVAGGESGTQHRRKKSGQTAADGTLLETSGDEKFSKSAPPPTSVDVGTDKDGNKDAAASAQDAPKQEQPLVLAADQKPVDPVLLPGPLLEAPPKPDTIDGSVVTPVAPSVAVDAAAPHPAPAVSVPGASTLSHENSVHAAAAATSTSNLGAFASSARMSVAPGQLNPVAAPDAAPEKPAKLRSNPRLGGIRSVLMRKDKSVSKLNMAPVTSTAAAVVESEFTVFRQNSTTAEYDLMRFLMVSATRIVEAEAESGETVVTLLFSDLCSVETIHFHGANLVKLVFFTHGGHMSPETAPKTVYVWKMADEDDLHKFVAICKARLSTNQSYVQTLAPYRCMQCDHTFTDGKAEPNCPVCGSQFVVKDVPSDVGRAPGNSSASVIEGTAGTTGSGAAGISAVNVVAGVGAKIRDSVAYSAAAVAEAVMGRGSSSAVDKPTGSAAGNSIDFDGPGTAVAPAPAPAPAIVPLPIIETGPLSKSDFLVRRDVDHGLELFLKLNVLTDASAETVLCLVKSDVVTFVEAKAASEIEKPFWVLFTTERLYLLAQTQNTDSQQPYGLTVGGSFPLTRFCRLTIGLFMSWVRFDSDQPVSHPYVLLLTSSHRRTHRLVEVLTGTMNTLPVHQVGNVTASVLKRAVLGGSDVRHYARVKAKRRSRRALFGGFEWVAKSLVFAADLIVLCDEDCGRWFVHLGGSPSFSDIVKHRLIDVCGVLDDGEVLATIEFDNTEARNRDMTSWSLEFATPQDKVRAIDALEKVWKKEMGGIRLPVK